MHHRQIHNRGEQRVIVGRRDFRMHFKLQLVRVVINERNSSCVGVVHKDSREIKVHVVRYAVCVSRTSTAYYNHKTGVRRVHTVKDIHVVSRSVLDDTRLSSVFLLYYNTAVLYTTDIASIS